LLSVTVATAGVTVKVVEPCRPLSVALMLVRPTAAPVATPPALIVAVAGAPEVHVTDAVIFSVDESL